ncbi:MAG: hypothetical protein ACTH5B_06535 [Marinomonas sp.]|uniref:hypothetical protein n=1 Tax=Marinomonas sp. TaxID=1904862 RepID=UPI003F97801C
MVSKIVDTANICCLKDIDNSCSKPAFLVTGAMVRVLLLINIGEVLRVDTRSSEYVSRATGK